MKLGTRLALVLAAVVAGYALIDHAIQRWVLVPSFGALERREGELAVERAQQSIAREVATLAREAASLSARLAERPAAAALPPAWPGPAELDAQRVHLLLCCGPDGRVAHARIVDPSTGAPLSLRDFPQAALSTSHWSLSPLRPGAPLAGLWLTESGPMLVAACSLRQDAAAERVVIGRFLDERLVERMSVETRSKVLLWPLEADLLPADERALVDHVTGSNEPVSRVTSAGELRCYAALSDVQSRPAFLLAVELPRSISAHGASTARYALISTLCSGLLLVFVLLLLLRRIVITPLARLTQHAEEIGRSDDLSRRLVLARSDEIGSLSRELDAMVAKLATSRAEVVETARAAGMSEIATGILHNVGNVLNSVNVSVDLLGQRLRESKTLLLERLAGVVSEHEGDFPRWVADDPQGRKLPPFLGALSRQISDERASMQEEVNALSGGVQHIRALVDAQQTFATQTRLEEPTSIEQEFERALKLSESVGGGARDIEIRREVEPGLSLRTDRHRLLDILVNLVQNARQALGERCDAKPLLVLRACSGPTGIVRVEIEDNGCGISAEHQSQLFRHGFTTKSTGHGFGLHASANAATQLGGHLTAHSEGLGKGARFTLELPGREAATRAA
jgi:signal transduction histidine kinase